jgi:hypothetical protein
MISRRDDLVTSHLHKNNEILVEFQVYSDHPKLFRTAI